MQGTTLRRFHFWRGCFWIALWVAAFVFGWLSIVTFVAHVSMAALVETAFMGWTSARAEVAAEDQVTDQ